MKHKRIISALMGLTMAFPAFSGCITANAEPEDGQPCVFTSGDVNGDGEVTVSDLVALSSYLLGRSHDIDYDAADFNQDGHIDIFDLIRIRREFLNTVPLSVLYNVVDLCDNMDSQMPLGLDADQEFILAQTSFALDLLKYTFDGENNDLISPYSVMQALAMTANGAKGETLEQMEKALGGIPIDKLNRYLLKQRSSQPDEEKCKLLTANSIWARNDESRIKVNENFLQTDMNYYNTEFYVAPFDDSTVDAINTWVSRNTDKMIPKLLDRIDPECVMHLINAVTFDAKWSSPYQSYEVSNGKFTAADGEAQEAEMLNSIEYLYLSDENAQGIMKYYSGGRYAFAALLPDEGVSLSDYIGSLTPERFNSIISEPEQSYVETQIPKFKYEYDTKLEKILPEMGMELPFCDMADFTGMNDADNAIYIGSVLHKTFIELDEEGTRAAAVTDVAMNDGEAFFEIEHSVILDRPFVYAIVDTETSLPVFIGALTSLS